MAKLRRIMNRLRGAARGHNGSRVQRGVKLSGTGTVRLPPGSTVREHARVYVGPGATLTVERDAVIGIRNIINAETGITIGEGSELSWDVELLDTDMAYQREGYTLPAGSGLGARPNARFWDHAEFVA